MESSLNIVVNPSEARKYSRRSWLGLKLWTVAATIFGTIINAHYFKNFILKPRHMILSTVISASVEVLTIFLIRRRKPKILDRRTFAINALKHVETMTLIHISLGLILFFLLISNKTLCIQRNFDRMSSFSFYIELMPLDQCTIM